ncbi:MAG: protein kinase [Pseudomonadota bacterium]
MAEVSSIGPYRLLEPLGHGGMGVVYRARHESTGRAVALKTVRVPAARWLDSIRREIHALTRIRHPGVVRIVDHGVQQGLPWYAMDLLEGETLRHFGQRIWSPYRRLAIPPATPDREGTQQVSATELVQFDSSGTHYEPPEDRLAGLARLSEVPPAAAGELSTVLHLMRRVSATLAFLHGEGFINCDLKPENVLIVDGQPIIIDFGLTSHHPGGYGRELLEAQRGMAGTLPYMSPEQIRGEFVDARSDLYALGCVLYELVVGKAPFTGSPKALISQHLSTEPAPPSALVEGVPPELEHLILKLLEKRLADRFGYADEVAGLLADLSGDVHRLPDYPPARSYLYRPQFAGRAALLAQVREIRDRAATGSGAMVLIGGESGVGKTRFAMEVTCLSPAGTMQIVTSESSLLSPESGRSVGAAPLHALRPLLRAVADRCQEGGPDTTERLLGPRRAVLALYEPLLADVPSRDAVTQPMPLSLEASRQRLFTYLADTLAAFAREQPLLLVLDDIGWADELSLAFLRSLSAEYLSSVPVLILATYRTEDASETVRELAALPHVVSLALPRLDASAVRSMISDMLALREPPAAFVEYVAREAEGNPFFVAEYLRTAVNERLLYRDQLSSWQVLGQDGRSETEYRSLPLPSSLRELIEYRLRNLAPAGQRVGLAAAVLGRETDLDVLLEISDVGDTAAVEGVDELLRRQVLEQPEPGRLRFAHEKLREVIYGHAWPERRRELHARAARALEARLGPRSDGREWAALGHHFAAAQLFEPAARYLKLAADHARATYANGEAIRLYGEAKHQIMEMLLRLAGDSATWERTLIELDEALGDVLVVSGRRDEARLAYDEALARAAQREPELRARLLRKIGKAWESQHAHEQALHFYATAEQALGDDPTHGPAELRDEWIQIQINQLWVYYWLDNVPEMDALIRRLEPVIEQHGSPLQRARFFDTLTMRNLRRDRYVSNEETLLFARRALDACRQSGDLAQQATAQMGLGLALIFNGQVEPALISLEKARAYAERGANPALQARGLTYLGLGARMLGDVERVVTYVEQSERAAAIASARDYVAAAKANRAWVSFKRGDPDTAVAYAREALGIWGSLALVFPLQWMALIPLLQVTFRRDLAQAVDCARRLLAPDQQSLPGDISDALARAVRCWANEDSSGATNALKIAIDLLPAAEAALER